MMRARRNVVLSSTHHQEIPRAHWLRIVRTAGIGVVDLVPRVGDELREAIRLPAADDGWLPFEGRDVSVQLVASTGDMTCDIEWLDHPAPAPPPLPAPRDVLLVSETFTEVQLGLTGILKTLDPLLYPNGLDLAGFEATELHAIIPSGWTLGVAPTVQAILILRDDSGNGLQDTSYSAPDVAQNYTASAATGTEIKFYVRFSEAPYRSDFNTNRCSLSSQHRPGRDCRYLDLMLRASAGTILTAPNSTIQIRGRARR